ncbi:hypothetical protein CA984_38905 [Streptosporangium minutum]|uniref:Uncharacterized protein n=1 Tax=Streptosporangium minutum TaxID=569862 RepID=A0A243QVE1_9ACTN|nr:hypothetical protein CA984_38905 [Streptosporangium minutum]
MAYGLLGSLDETEDVVQDAWSRLDQAVRRRRPVHAGRAGDGDRGDQRVEPDPRHHASGRRIPA